MHKDPLGTSAWNAVSSGAKRWIMFEPWVSRRLAKSKDLRKKSRGGSSTLFGNNAEDDEDRNEDETKDERSSSTSKAKTKNNITQTMRMSAKSKRRSRRHERVRK